MELIQEAITGLKEEMDQFQREGVVLEQQRQTILHGLEEELKVVEVTASESDGRHTAATRVLDQLKSGKIITIISVINVSNLIYCFLTVMAIYVVYF